MIEIEEDDGPPGTPAWMATFADLMSLLMCFFVLLLSFSEMDANKYKLIAGSMKNAFGVQNQVKVKDIPKGTSIIAKEFSPGRPTPTNINTVNQFTTQMTQPSLRVGNPDAPKSSERKLSDRQAEKLLTIRLEKLLEDTRKDALKLAALLKREIEDGQIDIETEGRSIIIRIREKGSFPSGSATLSPDFVPVVATLRDALVYIRGKIAVEGHTDNIPIASARFQSNWDLSSTRALSVMHELIAGQVLDQSRFMVIGYSDTQPVKDNSSSSARADNRRVEIVIRQGLDDVNEASLEDLQDPGLPTTAQITEPTIEQAAVQAGDTTAPPILQGERL